MNTFKMIFTFLIPLGIFCGCQAQKETIRDYGPRARTNNSDPTGGGMNGGSDTGGGNGVAGRPLESFRADITQREEFKLIQDRLKKLSKISVRLAAELLHVAQERHWFLAPVELNKLDIRFVGVSFMTDQLALHKKEEIYISTLYYDKMEMNDKAMLLLHEMVMGVRLMAFQGKKDQCLALATIQAFVGTEASYTEARNSCFSSKLPIEPDKKISLNDGDHHNVRDLTYMLFNRIDQLTENELKSWISQTGFRDWTE